MSDTFDHYFDYTSDVISEWEGGGGGHRYNHDYIHEYKSRTRRNPNWYIHDFDKKVIAKAEKYDDKHLLNYMRKLENDYEKNYNNLRRLAFLQREAIKRNLIENIFHRNPYTGVVSDVVKGTDKWDAEWD